MIKNPCLDKTMILCAGYNFCCPNNNSCSIVNGVNTCTPRGGGISVPPVIVSSSTSRISSISSGTSSSSSWISSSTSIYVSSLVPRPSSSTIPTSSTSPIISSSPLVSSSSLPVSQVPPVVTTTAPPGNAFSFAQILMTLPG